MICLTSFFNKTFFSRRWGILLIGLVLNGCSGLLATTPVERLRSTVPRPSVSSPQMIGSGPIQWQAEIPEIFAERTLAFEIRPAGENRPDRHVTESSTWTWQPETPGVFEVRVITTDENGVEVASRWSSSFEIVPRLSLTAPVADRDAPFMANGEAVTWSVTTAGGVGTHQVIFEFIEADGGITRMETGSSSSLKWIPEIPGTYRVRASVTDQRGNQDIGTWSPTFQIVPELTVAPPATGQPTPQMAGTGPFTWQAVARGGIGELSYRFELEKPDGTIEEISSDTEALIEWNPDQPGFYRARVRVFDERDHVVLSDWSQPFELSPPLRLHSLQADKASPQVARTRPIIWQVDATGGVAPLSYSFELEQNGMPPVHMLTKKDNTWAWIPAEQGRYRARVTISDRRGNQVAGPWSDPMAIEPALRIDSPRPQIPSPQVADSVSVPWTASASGGLAPQNYQYEISRGDEIIFRSSPDPESSWTWYPDRPGTYRARTRMIDALENEAVSRWSDPFVIAEPLIIKDIAPDRPSPQAVAGFPVSWQVKKQGGVPPYTYQFELASDEEDVHFVQQGLEDQWVWNPERAGRYRVRARVSDIRGNRSQSEWTQEYMIHPALQVTTPVTGQDAEQFEIGSKIQWQVESSGGVGRHSISFILEERGKKDVLEQKTDTGSWTWRPQHSGFFRTRATVVDNLGNTAQSDWSAWKEIRQPLAFDKLLPAVDSPQPALKKTIAWKASTVGGVGTRHYEFQLRQNGRDTVVQRGVSDQWPWAPQEAGEYQVRVSVRDENGNLVTSPWSEPYLITTALANESLVALFPLENLSNVKIPASEIENEYRHKLAEKGLKVLDRERLEEFMYRHRVRYTGGIGSEMAKALRKEEGVEAVIVTSVESYRENNPPQFALTSRLVLCGDIPKIAWIDATGSTGEDAPGLLGLGRIHSAGELIDQALDKLAASLTAYVASGVASGNTDDISPLNPQEHYLASEFIAASPYKIAIVPFLNRYARRNAGFIVPLHLARALFKHKNLDIVEPGLVREQLLKYRLIMQAGPSLAISDVLASETTIGADLILSGYIFDYQDDVGTPKIDFSTRLFSGPGRKILWWSRSYARGDDNVYFYDVGRVRSAHVLMQQMTTAISDLLFSR